MPLDDQAHQPTRRQRREHVAAESSEAFDWGGGLGLVHGSNIARVVVAGQVK